MTPRKRTAGEELIIERLKLEIAGELGLLDKIRQGGWGQLNAVEAGKIGGILANRMQKMGAGGWRKD